MALAGSDGRPPAGRPALRLHRTVRLRRNQGRVAREPDGVGQAAEVEGAVVAAAVEEERRSPRRTTAIRALEVFGDPGHPGATPQVLGEARNVETEQFGVPDQVRRQQRPLVL